MQRTVEAMLGYFNQIRQVYANELNKKFEEERFSPNEISVLILLSNNRTINTTRWRRPRQKFLTDLQKKERDRR